MKPPLSSSEDEDDFADLKGGAPSVETAPATPEVGKERVSDEEVTLAGFKNPKELQKAAVERIKVAEAKHTEDLKNLADQGGRFAKFPEIQALMKKQLEKTINEYQSKAGSLQEAMNNNDEDSFSKEEELPKPTGPNTEVVGASPPGEPVLADKEYRQDRAEDLEKVAQVDTLADGIAKEFQAFQKKYGDMELGVTEMRAGRIPVEKLVGSQEAAPDDAKDGVEFSSPVALDREMKHWDVAGKAFGFENSENVIVKDGAVRRLSEQSLTEAEMHERAAVLEAIIARGNELHKLAVDVISAEEGAVIGENIVHPEVKKAVQNAEAKIQQVLVRAQKDLDSFAYQEQDILPEEESAQVAAEEPEGESVFTNEKYQPELSLQEVDDMDMDLRSLEKLVSSDISAISEKATRDALLEDSLQSLERIADKQKLLPAIIPPQERRLMQNRIEALRAKLKSPNSSTQVSAPNKRVA